MTDTKSELIIADIRSHCSNQGISTGHFIPVARMYLELFRESLQVKIAGGPVYNHYFDKKDLVELPYNVCGDSLKHKIKALYNSFQLFQRSKGKTIIFQQSADVTTHLAIAFLYWGKSKIYLIRYSNTGINSTLKRVIYSLCKHKVYGIICPNNEVGESYKRPYLVVPDYIYLGDEDKKKDTATEKKYDFCIVGRIAEEKGVVEVAKWIAGKNHSLIIAGKPQTEQLTKELTNECQGKLNITLKLGYISDEEYNHILTHSRYAIMNYQGEYSIRSSGVVFDTLFAGVPIIGRRCKALDFIEKYKVGQLFEKIDDLSDANLKSLLLNENRLSKINCIKEYRQTHAKYKKDLMDYIIR